MYDGDGNRVSETSAGVTTKYLVDTLNPTGYSQVLDESVNGSVTRTYTYGLSRISEDQLVGSTWTPSFYGYDGHMNVRFLSNTPGVATDTYQFDAFGNPIASSGTTANAYLYSGERFDNNLSLYHLRARYYNSLTGRFVTLDYHQGTVLNPATLHKYTYTLNNPVNASDPSGLFAVETAVKDQVIFVVDLRVVALAAAEVCVLTRTATILGVLAQGAVPVDDGLCKVKPKPTCKSEFPKLIPVGALFDYRYKSESEAFAALQGEYPEQLKNGAKRPANEGPCAVGGPYEPGWHRNVLFVEGGESAGSLVGCPCCDESTGTPIRAQRWGIR